MVGGTVIVWTYMTCSRGSSHAARPSYYNNARTSLCTNQIITVCMRGIQRLPLVCQHDTQARVKIELQSTSAPTDSKCTHGAGRARGGPGRGRGGRTSGHVVHPMSDDGLHSTVVTSLSAAAHVLHEWQPVVVVYGALPVGVVGLNLPVGHRVHTASAATAHATVSIELLSQVYIWK